MIIQSSYNEIFTEEIADKAFELISLINNLDNDDIEETTMYWIAKSGKDLDEKFIVKGV